MKNLCLAILSVVIFTIGGDVNAQTKENSFKRWHFGLEGTKAIGSAIFGDKSTNFEMAQGGVQTQFMFLPQLGVETGVLYSEIIPNQFLFILDEIFSTTRYVGFEARYIDVPINVVFKPAFSKPNKKVSFTLNSGLQLNIPLIEKGRVLQGSWFGDLEETELKTGNPNEVRLYYNISPGMEMRFWDHTGMNLRLKCMIDPEITSNSSDFEYLGYLGISLGITT